MPSPPKTINGDSAATTKARRQEKKKQNKTEIKSPSPASTMIPMA